MNLSSASSPPGRIRPGFQAWPLKSRSATAAFFWLPQSQPFSANGKDRPISAAATGAGNSSVFRHGVMPTTLPSVLAESGLRKREQSQRPEIGGRIRTFFGSGSSLPHRPVFRNGNRAAAHGEGGSTDAYRGIANKSGILCLRSQLIAGITVRCRNSRKSGSEDRLRRATGR